MPKDPTKAKLRLLKKYEQLAKITKSKPKKQAFNHKAEMYRRQIEQLELLARSK